MKFYKLNGYLFEFIKYKFPNSTFLVSHLMKNNSPLVMNSVAFWVLPQVIFLPLLTLPMAADTTLRVTSTNTK